MSGRSRFALFFALVFLAAIIGSLFPPMAIGGKQLSPKAYLPHLSKNFINLPPSPPLIAIDYVPPFWAVADTDPIAIGRGRILNVDSEELSHLNIEIYIWRNFDDGWQKRKTGGGCGSRSSNINYSDGTFDFGTFGRVWATEIQAFRFYLTHVNYCPPRIDQSRYGLPPDPPADQVYALTEVLRIYPESWRLVRQLPQ